MNQETEYTTTDIGLASALLTTGESLLRVEPTSTSRLAFVFVSNAEIGHKEISYFNNSLLLNARAMFDNIRMLKARVHNRAP